MNLKNAGFHKKLLSLTALVSSMSCAAVEVQEKSSVDLNTHLQAGLNLVREDNLFWDLAETFAPSVDYAADTSWVEAYIKPGISVNYGTESAQFYGKGSEVASTTLGTDAYDTGDTGRVTLEEAYIGLKTKSDHGIDWDLSLGSREVKFGSGMLIANGATSGFERGALKLGPRKAWERSFLGKGRTERVRGSLFYLDPRELDSNNTDTRLAGGDFRVELDIPENFLGVTFGQVLQSKSPYAKAPIDGIGAPSIIENGRDGLQFINHYGLLDIVNTEQARYFIQWDAAVQQNSKIDLKAWAGRIILGAKFTQHPYKPTLNYTWQSFSGDDPFTDKLERFDPLYYEGSPSSWSTGSKSSMVFINSNVQAHQLTLKVSPSPQHILTLRAAHIRVNELRSPVQFGQASRLDFSDGLSTVITGVTDEHLADDYFVEYTYLWSRSVFLTLGLSVSVPGKGINKALGNSDPDWSGGFANIVWYL